MVHHLENGYVCNFISHILPDTEMPLDRKTGSWTRPRHSAAAGRSSTDPEASPQSTWAAFWSCFWWAIPLTLPKHFRLWNRLCGGRWSRAVTWSISRAGAGRVVLRLCPTGSSCTGPCSDRRWTELKLNHYFLSWELSVSVPQWLLPEPSRLPVLLPVPAMASCCWCWWQALSWAWRAGPSGSAALPAVTSLSYLRCRCRTRLMSQFRNGDAPAAIWEGSGPKNI